MPTKGSLAHLIGSLNASSLDGIVHSLGSQNITVNVPQMKITSNLQLATALAAMGMPNAFEPTADFAGFSSVPTQISEVKQQATLSLTKWGTVAAAATAVVSVASAAEIGPPPIVFNKPFLFLIRDTKTGAILFESEVFNPDAGG
jgi:serpin B